MLSSTDAASEHRLLHARPRVRGRLQSLQEKASEWSGVAAGDAFAVDDLNVFEALGGTPQPFVDLSTNFYTRVYEDEEELFREIFSGSRKEDAIRNQYEFLVQRMGGPLLFSQRRDQC